MFYVIDCGSSSYKQNYEKYFSFSFVSLDILELHIKLWTPNKKAKLQIARVN